MNKALDILYMHKLINSQHRTPSVHCKLRQWTQYILNNIYTTSIQNWHFPKRCVLSLLNILDTCKHQTKQKTCKLFFKTEIYNPWFLKQNFNPLCDFDYIFHTAICSMWTLLSTRFSNNSEIFSSELVKYHE